MIFNFIFTLVKKGTYVITTVTSMSLLAIITTVTVRRQLYELSSMFTQSDLHSIPGAEVCDQDS